MIKSLLAIGATAVTLASPLSAATVTGALDVFVTSNFNTSTLSQDTLYVDPVNQAGTLSFSYDTLDAVPNGFGSSVVSFDTFGAAFNLFPSTLQLNLDLGGISQTWTQPEFLIAEATVDLSTGSVLESFDFVLLTTGASASIADPNIIDITPEPGFNFLRFDTAGNVTGIEIELQTVSPIPLPASFPLLAGGGLLLIALRRKSKKS